MKPNAILLPLLILTACNIANVKPNSMDKSHLVYADRGGYTMRMAIKQELEERGYKITVGKAVSSKSSTDSTGEDYDVDTANIPKDARYVVKVKEREESLLGGPRALIIFSPIWCMFNGFWWWNFNVSISDQTTGDELLAWSGKGCANDNLRRLNRLMNQLEKKD